MDIFYPPKRPEKSPIVFYIHGGGFENGDKRSNYIFSVIKGRRKGFAIGSINYRPSYEKPFPAAVDDVRNAIRYARAHASELHIDPERIGVMGESAGGNLAAMLACGIEGDFFDRDIPAGLEDFSAGVSCAADLFGPLDFGTMYDQLKALGFKAPPFTPDESPEKRYLGTETLFENPQLVALANPITHVSPHTAPMFLMHGTKDHNVPINQTEELYAALKANGVEASYIPVENAAHMSLKFMRREYTELLWAFFEKQLK